MMVTIPDVPNLSIPAHLIELAQSVADETGHIFCVGERFEDVNGKREYHTGCFVVGDRDAMKHCGAWFNCVPRRV